ncbi:MAG: ATP-binding cassette domain-containing protein, partial [Bacteroidales bacterium]|nr:ATP-binding cassette domain-containing protein [Bacteroidales bacterium]
MQTILRVEGLRKSFGDLELFENVNFVVNKGDKVALVAKNGAGKTTLLNILAGND